MVHQMKKGIRSTVLDRSAFEKWERNSNIIISEMELKRCNFERLRLIQGNIDGDGAFYRLDMVRRRNFSDLWNWLTGGKIG